MENIPIIKTLDKGTYYICTCGKSDNVFCNGSHKGTDKTPTPITLDEPKTVALCGCGQSKNGIYCDGSHLYIKKD